MSKHIKKVKPQTAESAGESVLKGPCPPLR